MPKLYEYFGLLIFFYANEHEPIHVHAQYQERESKAEIIVQDGNIVEIRILSVRGKKPLERSQLADFNTLLYHYADDIVKKWIDFFVLRKRVQFERITTRLK